MGDYIVPAGFEVAVNVFALHTRVADWGPTAREFVPERWQGDAHPPTPWSFMPFSLGPRNCIGQKYGPWALDDAPP